MKFNLISFRRLNKYYDGYALNYTFHFNLVFRDVAQEELNAADKEKITGIAALTFTCSVTVVFYLFVKNALSAIKVFVTIIRFEYSRKNCYNR